MQGYHELLRKIQPSAIICYGKPFEEMKGNYNGQSRGTKAGRSYSNDPAKLPEVDSNGKDISYREFDVNDRLSGQPRDSERFVRGDNGRVYYTSDHYNTFIEVEE